MVRPPKDIAAEALAWINQNVTDDMVYTDGNEIVGREVTPHITVKYGLLTDKLSDVSKLYPSKPFKVKLREVSKFDTNPDYDVLKMDVESDALRDFNAEVSELKNEDSHPNYCPHMTIAYVKKGAGDALLGTDIFAGKEFTIDAYEFSTPDGTHIVKRAADEHGLGVKIDEAGEQYFSVFDFSSAFDEMLYDYYLPDPRDDKPNHYVTDIGGVKVGFGAKYMLNKILTKILPKIYPSGKIPINQVTSKPIPKIDDQLVRRLGSIHAVSYVAHLPGHKDAKGNAAPWVIKDHKTGKVLSSHADEAAAKKHLQDMHIHKGSNADIASKVIDLSEKGKELNAGNPAPQPTVDDRMFGDENQSKTLNITPGGPQ